MGAGKTPEITASGVANDQRDAVRLHLLDDLVAERLHGERRPPRRRSLLLLPLLLLLLLHHHPRRHGRRLGAPPEAPRRAFACKLFRLLWACLQWLAPSVAVFLLPFLKGSRGQGRAMRSWGQRPRCMDRPHETRAREGKGRKSSVHQDRVQRLVGPDTAGEGFPRTSYRGAPGSC